MSIPLWNLSTKAQETDTGAYMVMLSLSKMLSTGQGLLVVSVFFLDWDCILNPARSIFETLMKKIENVNDDIPEFPVMLPVSMSQNMRLPVSLLTNIAMSFGPRFSGEDNSRTAEYGGLLPAVHQTGNLYVPQVKQRKKSKN